MYGGELVEDQPAADIVAAHHHPYTAGPARLVRRPARRGRRGGVHPGPSAGPVPCARRLPVRAALPGRRSTPAAPITPSCTRPAEAPPGACSSRPRPRGPRRPAAVARGSSSRTRSSPRTRTRRGGADDEPVLVVDDVTKAYRVRRNAHDDDHPGGGRRLVLAAPRTGQRAGRPERLGQDDAGPVGHGRRAAHQWRDPVPGHPGRRAGPASPAPLPPARAAGLPGPVLRAQPDPHHRLCHRPSAAQLPGHGQAAGPPARRRAAGDGRDESARPATSTSCRTSSPVVSASGS